MKQNSMGARFRTRPKLWCRCSSIGGKEPINITSQARSQYTNYSHQFLTARLGSGSIHLFLRDKEHSDVHQWQSHILQAYRIEFGTITMLTTLRTTTIIQHYGQGMSQSLRSCQALQISQQPFFFFFFYNLMRESERERERERGPREKNSLIKRNSARLFSFT